MTAVFNTANILSPEELLIPEFFDLGLVMHVRFTTHISEAIDTALLQEHAKIINLARRTRNEVDEIINIPRDL
jgi:hypothetical protein